MAATNVRNGMDLDRMGDLVRRVQEDPTAAIVKFETRSHWEGGLRTQSEVSYFWLGGQRDTSRARPHTVVVDNPTSLLGGDSAASAIELMLAALGASLAIGVAGQAAQRGVTLEALDFTIAGDLDLRMLLGLSDRVHTGLQTIRVKGQVKADVSDEVLREIKEAAERASPVWNTLTRPVKIICSLNRG
jgi:uncharacterized OsmC-like protein